MGQRRLGKSGRLFIATALAWCIGSFCANGAELPASSSQEATKTQAFIVKGVVTGLDASNKTIIVRHEAVSNYMAAMTMPFRVKDSKELAGLRAGDEISFRLEVTDTESWIEQIRKLGSAALPEPGPADVRAAAETPAAPARHPLLDYKFTNELGQAVSLSDFHGQALAITFFFTRCPIPDFCPRLSKNFEEASAKLSSMPGAPTNWHFLSVSFDPEFDTPGVLKAYGESYHYDPKHWNFLTGPADKIDELARLSGMEVTRDGGLFNHNFRTLIVDAAGHLQTTFPFGGNLSEVIVSEMLRAAAAVKPAAARNPGLGRPPPLPKTAARPATAASAR